MFGDKESGSSETDSEHDDMKDDTDTKKSNKRKQKKDRRRLVDLCRSGRGGKLASGH